MSEKLANLIFPNIDKDRKYYEERYPERLNKKGKPQCCVRFAPSPTGFIHIGGLYTALINRFVADQNDGVMILRIEDTDLKRSVEGGVEEILEAFALFDIDIDEGAISSSEEKGDYGPYFQSKRKEIYQTFAKELLAKGDAYPCFCSPEDVKKLRERQLKDKSPIMGYAEEDAHCRHLSEEEQIERIEKGEDFIIRLRSRGSHENKKVFHDELRGEIEMPENNQDIVIIKADGLPTYHFAHAIDDHFMHTSRVIRADEWLSSLPIHVELFEILNFPLPKYYHLSPIMKLEGNSRRKLSKRLDPEARASYYSEVGYPLRAVKDYLMNIANSDFENWRRHNPDADLSEFSFDILKTSVSGALFDFDKLNNISKKVIANMSEEEIFEAYKNWLRPELDKENNREEREIMRAWVEDYAEKFKDSIHIWHERRQDVEKWDDIYTNYPYLYNKNFSEKPVELPQEFLENKEDIINILQAYLENYDHSDDNSNWFGKVRSIGTEFGYAAKPKDYKKNPDEYKGSVVHVSSYIRYALTQEFNTPDLHEMIHFMGEEEMRQRINNTIEALKAA